MVPEHKGYGEDLASGLEKLKKQVKEALVQPNTRENFFKLFGEKDCGELKKGKPKSNTGVNSSNVVLGKRKHNAIQPSGGNVSAKKVKGV